MGQMRTAPPQNYALAPSSGGSRLTCAERGTPEQNWKEVRGMGSRQRQLWAGTPGRATPVLCRERQSLLGEQGFGEREAWGVDHGWPYCKLTLQGQVRTWSAHAGHLLAVLLGWRLKGRSEGSRREVGVQSQHGPRSHSADPCRVDLKWPFEVVSP